MAKIDVYNLKRPRKARFEATFHDPTCSDNADFTMTFKKLTLAEQTRAIEIASEMQKRFVDGEGEPGKPGRVEPEQMAPIDGEPVYVSGLACKVAAFAFVAQRGPDADRFTQKEFLQLMVVDAYADKLGEIANMVCEEEAKETDPLASPPSEESSPPTVASETL